MAGDGKVPIRQSVQAGYGFLRTALRVVAPAAVGLAAIAAIAEVAPEAASIPFDLLAVGLSVVYSAFVLRLALRGDASGFYGLKFGKDEANLIGVIVWVGFFFFIVVLLAMFAFFTALVGAAQGAGVSLENYTGDPEAMAVEVAKIIARSPGLWALGLLEIAALIWLSTRLTLASAATIGEGRIMGFSTWSWTKGNTTRIFAATFIVVAPLFFGASFVVGLVAAAAGVRDMAAAPPVLRGVLGFLSALGQYLIVVPAAHGLAAYLYRGLRPPDATTPPSDKDWG